MNKILKELNQLLEKRTSLGTFIVAFLSVIALRVFIEQFVANSPTRPFYEIVIEYIHNLYFFLIAFVLLWIAISLILRKNPSEFSGIFTIASFLIIFPPILDILRTWGEVYWSFYIVSSWDDLKIQFLTVFGHLPSGIVYFGTKIVFISAIILMAGVVFLKTKNWVKTLMTVAISYIILFFMGSFPSIFAYFYYLLAQGRRLAEIQPFHIAQFFGSPGKIWGVELHDMEYSFPHRLDIIYFPILLFCLIALFYLIDKKKLWAVVQNLRFPQLIYHAGLFLIGMGLGYLSYPENFNWSIFSFFSIITLLSSIWLAWNASVVINDIEDLEIDKISNFDRPLPSGVFIRSSYAHFGLACFLLSLLGAISVGTRFFVLVLVYQIIAWFYSSHPFRLKKFPLVATAVSALASLTVLIMGFILMSPDQLIRGLPWRITLLLFISYTISLPIKDFKDAKGDGEYGIWTIPVIFGEKNSRLIVAIGIFTSFMMSVFFLNELRLFGWALLLGIVSFLIVTSSKINPRRLPWWIMMPVALYFLILVKIVFVDNLDKFIR